MWPIRVRAEREEPAITVLHDELARLPGRVAERSRELDSAGVILGVERIRVLDQQIGVEQFVRVFVGIWRRRIGDTEVNSVLVPRDDGIDRRLLPGAETLEAKLVSVIREGRRQVRREELGRDWRIISSTLPRGLTGSSEHRTPFTAPGRSAVSAPARSSSSLC
jgi:hypothetical protein